MSLRHKKYGGLVHYNHAMKTIVLTRRLNPLMAHARLVKQLQKDYPDYTIEVAK